MINVFFPENSVLKYKRDELYGFEDIVCKFFDNVSINFVKKLQLFYHIFSQHWWQSWIVPWNEFGVNSGTVLLYRIQILFWIKKMIHI